MEVINEVSTFVARALELIKLFIGENQIVEEATKLHIAVEHLDAALDKLTTKEKT